MKKKSKSKSKVSRFRPQKRSFAVTGYAFLWLILFVIGIVFTQALRNPVSYVFMIIVLILPFTELANTLIARASVSVGFLCGAGTVKKNEPVSFHIKIRNNSPLPVPFTEAEMILPDADGLGSSPFVTAVPLNSFGSYDFSRSVSFPYKGEYECRVENVYVSGLLRFFRIKVSVGRSGKLLILPRRLQIEEIRDRYVGETSSVSSVPNSGADSAEITEIKEYQPGDPIRNIHWKLSGKAQELITKHFGSENGMNCCVIADAGAAYGEGFASDTHEHCEDAVCELALFAATSRITHGRKTALVFVDDREQRGTIIKKTFDYTQQLDSFVPLYAACRQRYAVPAAKLAGFADDGEENDVIYVTAQLDAETVSTLCDSVSTNRAVTVIYYVPTVKAENAAELEKQAEAFAAELTHGNIAVRTVFGQELI